MWQAAFRPFWPAFPQLPTLRPIPKRENARILKLLPHPTYDMTLIFSENLANERNDILLPRAE
jgi:hypothetical protein